MGLLLVLCILCRGHTFRLLLDIFRSRGALRLLIRDHWHSGLLFWRGAAASIRSTACDLHSDALLDMVFQLLPQFFLSRSPPFVSV